MERDILHVNIAYFMASLEQTRNRNLRGEPFVIISSVGRRTVVLDLSPAAFREGIRRGDPVRRVEKMGNIKKVFPDFEFYSRAEKYLYKNLLPFAPLVESASKGHLFLDVSGTKKIFGNSIDHAVKVKRAISDKLNITPIVGLSANRLVSKVATRVVKPDGFIYVTAGEEKSFLSNQDVKLLPGIGPKLGSKMKMLGIREAGKLASLPDENLLAAFGKKGIRLRECARGIDYTPVLGEQGKEKYLSTERIFDSDTNDLYEIEVYLFDICEELGMTLRKNGYFAGSVLLNCMYTDGLDAKGHCIFERPVSLDIELFETLKDVLHRIINRRVRIRKISVNASRLTASSGQLDLFVPCQKEKNLEIQSSLDAIRSRFGNDAIKVGYSMRTVS